MRTSNRMWSAVVAVFIALSAADLLLTARLLDLGAVELNPLMAAFLDAGWLWAAAFKATVTVAVAAGLWFGRHHRIVRHTAIGFVALFSVLVSYQVMNLMVA